jgi:alkyl sulfatase BDS1-like metallo-beta-lactamase superfamily hydrolase
VPFEDQPDFEEAKKGFIAVPAYKQIKAEAGHVAWDMGSYEFLLKGKTFDSTRAFPPAPLLKPGGRI